MGPLDKQNLLKSQTSKKVKAANVPMKNISQKTMVWQTVSQLSGQYSKQVENKALFDSFKNPRSACGALERTCQLFVIGKILLWHSEVSRTYYCLKCMLGQGVMPSVLGKR